MLFHKLSENVRKFFSMFDRRAWTIIGTLMLANFVNTITFNCMDAFYPKEAHNRQIDTGHIGIVIGTYQLSRFLMAPFAGKYIMSVGPTLAFFFGLFVTAATAFGFGLLTLLPTGASFFWASIGIRMFQALARTSFVVSSLTITAQLFPDHVALLGGLLETFAGFGYISGPVIGSALFELGGFIAPNFTMGLLMLLLGLGFACCTTLTRNCWGDGKKTGGKIDCPTPSNMCRSRQPSGSWKGTLRLQQCPNGDLENPYINSSPADNADSSSSSEDNSSDADSTGISTPSMDECENAVEKGSSPKKLKKHSVGFRSVLRQGPTWLIMFVISLRGITCSFYQAPLPEHLVSLNNSALLVGAVLMVQSVAYFVSAPIWGILVERLHTRRLTAATLITLGGSLLAIGSTLLMGPFPLAQIQKSIPSMTASFALLGFSAAALYIPVFQQCADISRRESTEQDQTRVYAILFSLVQSSSTLGSFVGNIGGGFGAQHFGFPWTCSIVALSHLIFAIFLSTYTVISSSK